MLIFPVFLFYGSVLISVRFPLFHGSMDVQLLAGWVRVFSLVSEPPLSHLTFPFIHPSSPPHTPPRDNSHLSAITTFLIDRTNYLRLENGLPEVTETRQVSRDVIFKERYAAELRESLQLWVTPCICWFRLNCSHFIPSWCRFAIVSFLCVFALYLKCKSHGWDS